MRPLFYVVSLGALAASAFLLRDVPAVHTALVQAESTIERHAEALFGSAELAAVADAPRAVLPALPDTPDLGGTGRDRTVVPSFGGAD